MFPKNFPFGKSIWIWELWTCAGKTQLSDVTPADIRKIIEKCKANNITSVFIKCGDGGNTWQQWTQDLVNTFHAAGLKIYSWSFVYGANPLREAEIAMWALDMGADGHIFDAEDQYEKVSDPATAAEAMLQAVRGHTPNAFLAHSPEPIIDYHPNFPYAAFGKYCDAVLPQVYFAECNKSPVDGLNWMFDNWIRWQNSLETNGNEESIKPIIPVCQAFDWTSTVPGVPDYVLKPQDILDFCNTAKGYKAVSFWSFQHILRDDCWTAVQNAVVDAPTNSDLGLPDNPNTQSVPSSTTIPTPPVQNTSLAGQQTSQPTPNQPQNTPSSPQNTDSTTVSLPPDGKVIVITPNDGQVSVVAKKSPDGVVPDLHISHQSPPVQQKVLLDYILEFFTYIAHFFHKKGKEVKN